MTKWANEMVTVNTPCGARTVLAWALVPGEKVSATIRAAAVAYLGNTGQSARYVLIGTIPTGAQEFVEVENVSLVKSDWVPPGYLVLTAGGVETIIPEYRVWKVKETHL